MTLHVSPPPPPPLPPPPPPPPPRPQRAQPPADIEGVRALAARRAPRDDVARLDFELVSDDLGASGHAADGFQLATRGTGTLVVRGGSLSALSRGLGFFYRAYCGAELLSWANRAGRAAKPCVREALAAGLGPCAAKPCRARVRYRYYLNQVTWSYSMAWWGWPRWEAELDWMALRGINLALAHVGQEAIWQRVWQASLGSETPFDADGFFTSPAYLSWQRMGNLQGLGAPLRGEWMRAQLSLQHRILGRMADLGIAPILPAFNLHVPREVKDAESVRASLWSGFGPQYSGVRRLAPHSPLVHAVARRFVEELHAEFGSVLGRFDVRHYSVDLFNEMDPAEEDVAAAFRAAFDPVVEVDGTAVLVVQMWCFAHDLRGWPPARAKAFMDAVPADRVVYLDLHGEARPQWRRLGKVLRDEQLVWVYLHNFGGAKGMAGEMRHVRRAAEAALSEGRALGLGLAMEGIEQNELVYDHVLALAWLEDPSQTAAMVTARLPSPPDAANVLVAGPRGQALAANWLDVWVAARYGTGRVRAPAPLLEAWRCAVQVAYDRPRSLVGWGNTKSVLELPPGLFMETSDFQPTAVAYGPRAFEPCARSLFKVRPRPGLALDWDVLRYDGVDFLRQVISDRALEVSRKVAAAARERDWQAVASGASKLADLADELGNVLAQHWQWNATMVDVDTTLFNAAEMRDFRELFTRWSPHSALLDSYASRQAADVVKGLYVPRWRLWARTTAAAASRGSAPPDLEEDMAALAHSWTWSGGGSRQGSQGESGLAELAARLLGA